MPLARVTRGVIRPPSSQLLACSPATTCTFELTWSSWARHISSSCRTRCQAWTFRVDTGSTGLTYLVIRAGDDSDAEYTLAMRRLEFDP